MATTAARFGLTLDGHEIASFSELVQSSGSQGAVGFRKVPGNVTVLIIPAQRAPLTLSLRRPRSNDLTIWAWHQAARRGDAFAARKSCSLVMYDAVSKPVARYTLQQAWPSKIDISARGTSANDVAIETITLTCEKIDRTA